MELLECALNNYFVYSHVKKVKARLCELSFAARGSQDVGSRNLSFNVSKYLASAPKQMKIFHSLPG